MASNLKPISTRPRGGGAGPSGGDVEGGRGGGSPVSSSGVATPKGRGGAEPQSESPAMGSDSSSPWRRFFRGGSRYPNSDVDSFSNSPRNLMGFSPKATSSRSDRRAWAAGRGVGERGRPSGRAVARGPERGRRTAARPGARGLRTQRSLRSGP
jgi:hypothetical protein